MKVSAVALLIALNVAPVSSVWFGGQSAEVAGTIRGADSSTSSTESRNLVDAGTVPAETTAPVAVDTTAPVAVVDTAAPVDTTAPIDTSAPGFGELSSDFPSMVPGFASSDAPSDMPSDAPSDMPSLAPSGFPSDAPSLAPASA